MVPKSDIELKAHAAWEADNLKFAFEAFLEGAIQGFEGCMLDVGYFYDEGTRVTTNIAQMQCLLFM